MKSLLSTEVCSTSEIYTFVFVYSFLLLKVQSDGEAYSYLSAVFLWRSTQVVAADLKRVKHAVANAEALEKDK